MHLTEGACVAVDASEGGPATSMFEVDVLGALTGDRRCIVTASAAWRVSRLKFEIARVEGTPVRQQRLLLPGATALLRDDALVGEALAAPPASPRAVPPVVLLVREPVRPIAAGPEPGPGTLVVDAGDCSQVVRWAVEAESLRRSLTGVVSPSFDVRLGDGTAGHFKLSLVPRGATTFRRAGGRSRVQLKCQSGLEDGAPLAFTVSVTTSMDGERTDHVMHDFARLAMWAKEVERIDSAVVNARPSAPRGTGRNVVVVRLEVFA